MITAVDLIIGKIIEAAIQEGKGELKGVPSSQIVPYDPSKETDDSNLNDQVYFLMISTLTRSRCQFPGIFKYSCFYNRTVI